MVGRRLWGRWGRVGEGQEESRTREREVGFLQMANGSNMGNNVSTAAAAGNDAPVEVRIEMENITVLEGTRGQENRDTVGKDTCY